MSKIPPKGTLPSFDDLMEFVDEIEMHTVGSRQYLAINLRKVLEYAARIVDNPDDEDALDELNELLR